MLTYPECLSKQKITSFVGSRAHHSFPWSMYAHGKNRMEILSACESPKGKK